MLDGLRCLTKFIFLKSILTGCGLRVRFRSRRLVQSCPKFGRKMCRVNFSHNIRVTLFAVLLDGDYSKYYLDSLSSFRLWGVRVAGSF